MAEQRGGARPRAGRKRKATKYELAVTEAEDKIVDHLPQIYANLKKLADGGFEVAEKKWLPRKAFSQAEVLAFLTDGKESEEAKLAIEKPDELVLSELKTYYALPDRAANIYMMDRILGKPIQKQDIDMNVSGLSITVRHVTVAPKE